jgi:hypothetical protein
MLNDGARSIRQQKHFVIPLKETKVCGDLKLRTRNYLCQFRVQRFSVSDKDVKFNAMEGFVFGDP